MFFKKRPKYASPMDHFLNREQLNSDERAVLDVYLTGVSHALTGLNAVRTSNDQKPIFHTAQGLSLDATEIEDIVGEFLKQRPDMQNQPLGLCAVMAVLQRFPA